MEVPENTLLIDLGNEQITMIKIFGSRIGDSHGRIDLKLNAYYISYNEGLVAFFFIQRNKDKHQGTYATHVNQSGVEFMVVHTINELLNLSVN